MHGPWSFGAYQNHSPREESSDVIPVLPLESSTIQQPLRVWQGVEAESDRRKPSAEPPATKNAKRRRVAEPQPGAAPLPVAAASEPWDCLGELEPAERLAGPEGTVPQEDVVVSSGEDSTDAEIDWDLLREHLEYTSNDDEDGSSQRASIPKKMGSVKDFEGVDASEAAPESASEAVPRPPDAGPRTPEAAPGPSGPPDAGPAAAPRAFHGRSERNRDEFAIKPYGLLRFAPNMESISAVCTWPGHGDCRMVRTVRGLAGTCREGSKARGQSRKMFRIWHTRRAPQEFSRKQR